METTDRFVSIFFGALGVSGVVWSLLQPGIFPLGVGGLLFAGLLWIPAYVAAVTAPVWMAKWVSRRAQSQPRFKCVDWPGRLPPKGLYLAMEVDLRKPVERSTIVSAMRQICGSAAAVAAAITVASALAFLIWRQPWMLGTAAAFLFLVAREIYPRAGIRYKSGWLNEAADVRALCLVALGKALLEETSIQDWHPVYFKIIEEPRDESTKAFVAASWIFTYALLRNDLPAAAKSIECARAILPAADLIARYIGLGDALHFHTAVMPDEEKSRDLARRLREFEPSELPPRESYIEAARALVEGDREEARSIVQSRLGQIGAEGGSAKIRLERELLDRISSKL
jgi:hypothetical protein